MFYDLKQTLLASPVSAMQFLQSVKKPLFHTLKVDSTITNRFMFLQVLYIVYELYCSYLSLNWVKVFTVFCPKFNI